MKTLHPLDETTYAKIGKAYLICSEFPDVFGNVTFRKFCSMFVDVIDDDEDEHEARKRAAAHDMYKTLKEVHTWCQTEGDLDEDIESDIWEVLRLIDGEETEE